MEQNIGIIRDALDLIEQKQAAANLRYEALLSERNELARQLNEATSGKKLYWRLIGRVSRIVEVNDEQEKVSFVVENAAWWGEVGADLPADVAQDVTATIGTYQLGQRVHFEGSRRL